MSLSGGRDTTPPQPPTPTRCTRCDRFPAWPRGHTTPRLCGACWADTDRQLDAQFADKDHP